MRCTQLKEKKTLDLVSVQGLVLMIVILLSTIGLVVHSNSIYSNDGLDPIFYSMFFGLGPEADVAVKSSLVKESKIKILTCWINNRTDIDTWFKKWIEDGFLEQLWDKGYIIHIITYGWKEMHASQDFVDDMEVLSNMISKPDDGKHYVLFSLATEFQTYVEPNNEYNSKTALFYDRLMFYLREAKNAIRANSPNAKVSFCWGGWQARWEDLANGGGRSMFKYFSDLMKEMDFMSFQLMQGDGNIGFPHNDLEDMIDAIRPYNPHLMVAHYKPEGSNILENQAVFNMDISNLFTNDYAAAIKQKGLFAFSFMNNIYLTDPVSLETVIQGINAHTITE